MIRETVFFFLETGRPRHGLKLLETTTEEKKSSFLNTVNCGPEFVSELCGRALLFGPW